MLSVTLLAMADTTSRKPAAESFPHPNDRCESSPDELQNERLFHDVDGHEEKGEEENQIPIDGAIEFIRFGLVAEEHHHRKAHGHEAHSQLPDGPALEGGPGDEGDEE